MINNVKLSIVLFSTASIMFGAVAVATYVDGNTLRASLTLLASLLLALAAWKTYRSMRKKQDSAQ